MDCNCRNEIMEKLSSIPEEWRLLIADTICQSIIEDRTVITCDEFRECETLTELSEWSQSGNTMCITYKDEKGISHKRCFTLPSPVDISSLDPKCIAGQTTWSSWSPVEQWQALIDKFCDTCITTSTTTSSTTTTTTVKPSFGMTVCTGNSSTLACDCTTSQIVYISPIVATGSYVYEDSSLTIPYNNSTHISIGGIWYAVNGTTGLITSTGSCPTTTTTTSTTTTTTIAPNEATVCNGVSYIDACDCGDTDTAYFSAPAIAGGITIYSNSSLTTPYPTGIIMYDGNIYNVVSGVLTWVGVCSFYSTTTTTTSTTTTTTLAPTTTTTTTTTSTTTTTTEDPNNIVITNNLDGSYISSVTPSFYFINTGSFPIPYGQEINGSCAAFTGTINVNIAIGTSTGKVYLVVNGIEQDCKDVESTGSYDLSAIIANGDEVEIFLETGSC